MPVADPSFGWQEAAAAFATISVVAFLVSWVVTDLGRVSRTPYVAILAVTTFALAGGYLAWSGTSVVDLVTDEWALGFLGGVVAAALLTPLVRRLPRGLILGALRSSDGSCGKGSSTGQRRRSFSPRCRCSPSGRQPMRSAGRTLEARGPFRARLRLPARCS